MDRPTCVSAGAALQRIWRFVRRHKQAEETAAEAVGLNILWAFLRYAGVLGAGAAAAAIATTAIQTTTYHPSFVLSSKGAAFVARNEGLRTTPYNDPFNCTVGVGHLIHMGVCSSSDYRIYKMTVPQAYALLERDAGSAESYVRRFVTHAISQPQFDALVDLTFNIGGGGLERSSALRELNAGRLDNVPDRLLVWSYANGRYLPGLHSRRVAEGVLFTRGYYGDGIGYYTPPKPAPPVNPRAVPSPVPSWAWAWVEWKLGRGAYKSHAGNPARRPSSAPKQVPAWAWTFLARFTRTTR